MKQHLTPTAEQRLFPNFNQTPGEQAWYFVSDQVMGGVSHGEVHTYAEQGQIQTCLQGQVSLENNGGFIQMQWVLDRGVDLSQFSGFYVDWRGQTPALALHLKTDQLMRPWQSYRYETQVSAQWQRQYIAFTDFAPYRTDTPLDLAHVRRLAVIALGEAGAVQVCVREMGLYRS